MQLNHAHWNPRFHFTAPGHWINDPNGLIVHDGLIHLFYQVNPDGIDWGNISWGHAVGRDYISWENRGLAIPDTPKNATFSGCIVNDSFNTSGLGTADSGPLIALYTAARHDNYIDQHQYLAYSNDGGATWIKHADNPVFRSPRLDMRDPKVFWHTPTDQWIMALVHADLHEVGFYASPNLIDWVLLSAFGNDGCDAGEWECADLVKLTVEDSDVSRHVLIVSVAEGLPSGGSGVQYFVGTFDGQQFTRDPSDVGTRWIDNGPDFYAAQSWTDVPASEGRLTFTAWMSNRDYADKTPTTEWRSCHTLPRELKLKQVDDYFHVHQQPVREIENYRAAGQNMTNLQITDTVSLDKHGIAGQRFELQVATTATDGALTISLLRGPDHDIRLVLCFDSMQARIERQHVGAKFSPTFDRTPVAAIQSNDQATTVRVFVDGSTLEVFINDGAIVFSSLVFPPKNASGIALSSTSAEMRIDRLDFWPLTKETNHVKS